MYIYFHIYTYAYIYTYKNLCHASIPWQSSPDTFFALRSSLWVLQKGIHEASYSTLWSSLGSSWREAAGGVHSGAHGDVFHDCKFWMHGSPIVHGCMWNRLSSQECKVVTSSLKTRQEVLKSKILDSVSKASTCSTTGFTDGANAYEAAHGILLLWWILEFNVTLW